MPEPHVVAITPALLREVSGLDDAERATACAALNLHLAHHGVHGHIGASRVTWGYKCGLRWEVHGTNGTIIFEQERLNELKLFTSQDDPATDGFRTILTGPDHPPYSAFLPNGGHSLGYMDVKICELHELLQSIETSEAAWPSFNDGLVIEQVMDAVDKSSLSGQWVDVGSN